MQIEIDSPHREDVRQLIDVHVAESQAVSEVSFAIGADDLSGPDVVFLTARSEDGRLLGMGALKDHLDGTGELKSLRSAQEARGQGVGAALVDSIIRLARDAGMTDLNLETGTEEFFEPARLLYLSRGFVQRGPFGSYAGEPGSVYYTLHLAD